MLPSSGASRLAAIISSVLLPDPLGPYRATISSAWFVSVTPLTARTVCSPPRKCLTTPRSSSALTLGAYADGVVRLVIGAIQTRATGANCTTVPGSPPPYTSCTTGGDRHLSPQALQRAGLSEAISKAMPRSTGDSAQGRAEAVVIFEARHRRRSSTSSRRGSRTERARASPERVSERQRPGDFLGGECPPRPPRRASAAPGAWPHGVRPCSRAASRRARARSPPRSATSRPR